ncbi:MAG: glycosyltransferase family 39 protein [Comamonadaceae bacterium]|nr:glycosyltransferase family 39 protein [Comamonadaceae bacterium]
MAAGDWDRALEHDYHPLYCVRDAGRPARARAAPTAPTGWERSAVAVSIAAGAASVVLLYALVRRLFDPAVAAIAALILAVHPSAGAAIPPTCRATASTSRSSSRLRSRAGSRSTGAAWAWRRGRAPSPGSPISCARRVSGRSSSPGVAALRTLQGRWRPFRLLPFGTGLAAGALLVMTPYLVVVRVDTGEWQATKKKSVSRLAGAGAPYPPEEEKPAARLPPFPWRRASRAGGERGRAEGRRAAAARARAGEAVRESVASIRYEIVVFLLLGLWARRGRPGDAGVFVGAHVALYAAVLYARWR